MLQSPSCDLPSCHGFEWDHSLLGLCALSVSGYWAFFICVPYWDVDRILSTRPLIETWFTKLTCWLQVVIKQDIWSHWDLKTAGYWSMTAAYSTEIWLVYIVHKKREQLPLFLCRVFCVVILSGSRDETWILGGWDGREVV